MPPKRAKPKPQTAAEVGAAAPVAAAAAAEATAKAARRPTKRARRVAAFARIAAAKSAAAAARAGSSAAVRFWKAQGDKVGAGTEERVQYFLDAVYALAVRLEGEINRIECFGMQEMKGFDGLRFSTFAVSTLWDVAMRLASEREVLIPVPVRTAMYSWTAMLGLIAVTIATLAPDMCVQCTTALDCYLGKIDLDGRVRQVKTCEGAYDFIVTSGWVPQPHLAEAALARNNAVLLCVGEFDRSNATLARRLGAMRATAGAMPVMHCIRRSDGWTDSVASACFNLECPDDESKDRSPVPPARVRVIAELIRLRASPAVLNTHMAGVTLSMCGATLPDPIAEALSERYAPDSNGINLWPQVARAINLHRKTPEGRILVEAHRSAISYQARRAGLIAEVLSPTVPRVLIALIRAYTDYILPPIPPAIAALYQPPSGVKRKRQPSKRPAPNRGAPLRTEFVKA